MFASGIKWRVTVFIAVTTVVAVAFAIYEFTVPRAVSPAPNFLGSTWYGPWLVLLVPSVLMWTSFAATSRSARVFGWVCANVLFFVVLLMIFVSKDYAHTLPACLQPRDV